MASCFADGTDNHRSKPHAIGPAIPPGSGRCAFWHIFFAGASLRSGFAQGRTSPCACDAEVQGARLLVGVDEDEGVPQLLLVQDGVELLCRRADALRVTAVHHIDDGLRTWELSQGRIFLACSFCRAVKPLPTILMHVDLRRGQPYSLPEVSMRLRHAADDGHIHAPALHAHGMLV